ncbi:hypothetical protein [Mucilaginibacter psychrotolerans]|uniref:Uncharacterized protein n=1 Tax=Mucilaginibacter psychrotolerans TaxID=1524096 RepID=A0A4Y8SP89_9SPHI|nr:hypothetical protein [Mucilaginibacter psychrotolerans]TFF40758.1 hypothetical protein E2R66_00855 [Mucilaginibacter psychrotolerans]
MKFLKTFLQTGIFLVLLALLPVCLVYSGYAPLLIPQFWVLFGFFGVLTFMLLTGMQIVRFLKPEMYAQAFLIATIVKMMMSMGLALIFVLKLHIGHGAFLANFFYLYFLNTGFEVYVLLRNLRNQN